MGTQQLGIASAEHMHGLRAAGQLETLAGAPGAQNSEYEEGWEIGGFRVCETVDFLQSRGWDAVRCFPNIPATAAL